MNLGIPQSLVLIISILTLYAIYPEQNQPQTPNAKSGFIVISIVVILQLFLLYKGGFFIKCG